LNKNERKNQNKKKELKIIIQYKPDLDSDKEFTEFVEEILTT